MYILYILHTTQRYGGATKSFLTMLYGLKNKGVSPIVVVPDCHGVYTELVNSNIKTIAIPYRADTYPTIRTSIDYILFLPRIIVHQILNLLACHRLYHRLKDLPIDIIHTNSSIIDIRFRLSAKLSVPHIYHFREYADIDFGYYYFPCKRRLLKELRQPKSFSICITKDIQRYHLQNQTSRSRIIYNGIHDKIDHLNININKEDCFLFAGRVEPSKDVIQILEAYTKSKLKTPLYIAGATTNNDYLQSVQEFIHEHHLGSIIQLIGQHEDIDSLMRKAKAIIISSHFEAFGRCMAEAMFNGCLVIGRNTGGTKEQFDNGLEIEGNEIGLRYETTEELAKLLEEVETKSTYYNQYVERAFHVVNTLYTSEANIQKTYEFYEDITKKKYESKSHRILSTPVPPHPGE